MRPTMIEVTPELRKFGRVYQPGDAPSPILTGPVRQVVHRWLLELQMEAKLKAVKLAPRKTGLLKGPPGCGKTTLAHHVAARLGIALVEVSMPSLVGSLIGQTGRHVAELFGAAKAKHRDMILFLDEIDSIATKRTEQNTSAGRDDNHTVISLMSELDHYPGIVMAATNRPDALDPALWRRFGLQLEVSPPDNETRYAILAMYFEPYTIDHDTLLLLTDLTVGASPALLKQLVEGVKRDLILQPVFNEDPAPAAVFYRVCSGLEPHADAACPPLWEDPDMSLQRLADIPWPPQTTAPAATQGTAA